MSPYLIFALIVGAYIVYSIKILNEYERGVIFRLGKLFPRPKGPGVMLVFAPIDRMVWVSLRRSSWTYRPRTSSPRTTCR